MTTSYDELCKVSEILSDLGVEVDLDWYDDDTAYSIMVTVDGDWKKHIKARNLMRAEGYKVVDCDTIPSDSDSFTATYWFN